MQNTKLLFLARRKWWCRSPSRAGSYPSLLEGMRDWHTTVMCLQIFGRYFFKLSLTLSLEPSSSGWYRNIGKVQFSCLKAVSLGSKCRGLGGGGGGLVEVGTVGYLGKVEGSRGEVKGDHYPNGIYLPPDVPIPSPSTTYHLPQIPHCAHFYQTTSTPSQPPTLGPQLIDSASVLTGIMPLTTSSPSVIPHNSHHVIQLYYCPHYLQTWLKSPFPSFRAENEPYQCSVPAAAGGFEG
ncbi:hypothetical protein EV401DRAFT_2112310 [Pisolithus croceorrhizus]|nr:hypothetical protein EV401DRAFT_2112310 [Pisolithus croceorrhizus]